MSPSRHWPRFSSPPADLVVGERLGAGHRCEVFAARWRGQDLVIKRYRQAAIEKHARLACEPLAEFEYRRNRACHSVAGLQRHVARPIGFLVGTGSQWLLQERIDGRLCSELGASWPDEKWRAVQARLGELVELAHLAGVHDLDLHPRNVMLTVGPVMVEPVLFDFNLVPFTERRRPTLAGWLHRFGFVDETSRDLRRLRRRFRPGR